MFSKVFGKLTIGNGKVQKLYLTRMHNLVNGVLESNSSYTHVVINYNTAVTSYRKARRDFGRFWARFSRAFPYCDCMCSIDKEVNGSWYFNLLLFDKDSYDLSIPLERLASFWSDAGLIETPLLQNNVALWQHFLPILKTSLMYSPQGIDDEEEEEEEDDEDEDEDEEDLS